MSKMVLDLNSEVTVTSAPNRFEQIPAGRYECVVSKVGEWEAKDFANVAVNLRDDSGKILKDDNGDRVTEKMDFTAYSANVVLDIVDGDFYGRKIFTNVTTHPNVLFLLEGFIYAIKADKGLRLTDLADSAVGKRVAVDVYHRTYEKRVVDPDTAKETKVPVVSVSVKSFMRPKDVDYDTYLENDSPSTGI